ncbi:hypothetical protein [Sphingomonas echinoides]|uniref:Uncharacterized protein n=1 Tax=Sphingomonas echinoides TaxID=59803 RepID=A0ABU4PKG6_9SPHN|nr:hypothetical protein [Sphingomonas echinoides]MDX5984666.1 hypothetical protein [Sphingomonas echinoides]
MAKPTLQEIAAMPYPASLQACRRYYDRHWALFDDRGEREIVVTIDFEVTSEDQRSYAILASSVEQAESEARELLHTEVHGISDVLNVHLRGPHHDRSHPTFSFDRVH